MPWRQKLADYLFSWQGLLVAIAGLIAILRVYWKNCKPIFRKCWKFAVLAWNAEDYMAHKEILDGIRELKRGQGLMTEKFRISMDNRDMPTFELTPDGLMSSMSKRFVGIMGGTNENELKAWGWLDGIHKMDRDRVYREWNKLIAQKRDIELDVILAVGAQATLVATCVRADGELYGYQGTIKFRSPPAHDDPRGGEPPLHPDFDQANPRSSRSDSHGGGVGY